MNYTQKLTLSMLVPTVMVAGAGGSVAAGVLWLRSVALSDQAALVPHYLTQGAVLISVLTAICVASCIGFTVWIRRTALKVLGGDPSTANAVLTELARGRLDTHIPPAPPNSLLDVLARLGQVLKSSFGEIGEATRHIAHTSQGIAQGSEDLHQRTQDTAAHLHTTVTGVTELTQAVHTSTQAAHNANQLASEAVSVARLGGDKMRDVVSTMQGIRSSSLKISDITGVIDSIAFQTNILALNAAVEAARAGDQGRGFAVVASEVRTLATRSAQAAREIKALIGQSVDQVGAGSHLVEEAGTTMDEIVSAVQRVSSIMTDITEAAGHQSHGLSGIQASMQALNDMTRQNGALVQASASAAEDLNRQTASLSHALKAFQIAQG